jgi:hypothetical protein
MAQQLTVNQMIAQEIINQIGGVGRLQAMIGANAFVAVDAGVMFKFKGSRKWNCIEIKFNGRDLYDVTFYKITKLKIAKQETIEDIYNDQLKGLIERHTGLYLSL